MILVCLFLHISLADSLFSDKSFEEARVEYLREFFFSPEAYADEHKRISFALSTLHHDTLAGVHELNKLMIDIPDLSFQTKLRIARQFIALGYTSQARRVLHNMDSIRLYGYTFIQEGDLVSAREHFLDVGDTLIALDIEQYLAMPKKSVNTATLLSVFCPGTGEIYAGNTFLGVKDLLLNAGSIYLLYNALRQKKYVDAVLVFTFLTHRFYTGSLYNAQKTVFEANKCSYEEWRGYMHRTYFQDKKNH